MPLENLYFRHEQNARNNPKLLKLKMKLGMEGIGIYWCLIEVLYELNGYLKEEDLETFCFNEHVDFDKVKLVLKLANFKVDKENGYYSNGVLERIKKREEFCKEQKKKAQKRWSKEKKQAPVPDWYPEYEKENQEVKQETDNKTNENLQEIAEKLFNDDENK